MTSTGADIPAAIAHLAQAGYPVRRIADDLGVARSTVHRWRTGRHQPNPANLATLVQRVNTWYSTEVHRRRLTVASVHLRDAADALVTDAQRAREDALAADIRQHLAAGQRHRAELAQLADAVERSQRPARTSITRSADPFALVGAEPYQEVFPL